MMGNPRDSRRIQRLVSAITREEQAIKQVRAVLCGLIAVAASPSFAQDVPNSSPAAVEAGAYVVEPNHTQVRFSVLHMGFTFYNGGFSGVSGDLDLEPKTAAGSTVRVSVPVASVTTTSAKLDEELKSADWLDATKFPAMTFKSTTVTPGEKDDAKVMGDLTLHGVTKSVTIDVHFIGSGTNPLSKKYTAGFKMSGVIKRSDFGVSKFVPLIGDDVHVEINGAFVKK